MTMTSRASLASVTRANGSTDISVSDSGLLVSEVVRILQFLRVDCDWRRFDAFCCDQVSRGALPGVTHFNQDQCRAELFRFLVMKAVCLDYDADMITPSPVVDELWRTLLLFPVLYTTV